MFGLSRFLFQFQHLTHLTFHTASGAGADGGQVAARHAAFDHNSKYLLPIFQTPRLVQELMEGGSLHDMLRVVSKTTKRRLFSWYNRWAGWPSRPALLPPPCTCDGVVRASKGGSAAQG